jgi:hypothetical protein
MLELMAEGAVSVIGLVPEKLILAFAAVALVVAIVLPSRTFPDPFCVNTPLEERVFPEVVVNVPLLTMEMGPAPVVVMFSKKVNTEPVK